MCSNYRFNPNCVDYQRIFYFTFLFLFSYFFLSLLNRNERTHSMNNKFVQFYLIRIKNVGFKIENINELKNIFPFIIFALKINNNKL